MASFIGFPKEGILFLAGLERNNSRAWFADNKLQYEAGLKAPANEFLAALCEVLSERLGAAFDGKIFRIHCDVRFAKDKTPYNPFVRMAFRAKGNHAGAAYYYLSLEASKLILGVGTLVFSKQQLAAYRTAIDDPGQAAKLMALLADLRAKNYRIEGSELKRVPPGYPKDHKHEEMLRRKGLALWLDLKHPAELGESAFVEFCGRHFSTMRPAYDWLAQLENTNGL